MTEQEYPGFLFQEKSGHVSNYVMESNGLEVLLLPQELAPVVVFMITYRVGSRNESAGETGATHFLEHLMFKGTDRFNKRNGSSVFSELQQYGARVNATTWMDRTNYYALLPSDRLEKVIEIEADRMRGALLASDDVASERTVILNEHDRGENDPGRKLYQSVWSSAFIAHPYRHPTIGWRSDIETISPESLKSFYDTFYWPDNATVSVIGSFDPGEALALIRKYFGEIGRSPTPFPGVTTVEPRQQGERRTTIRMVGEPASLMMTYHAVNARDPMAPALDVLSVILGHGKTSRMQRKLIDSGLALGVSVSASLHRDAGLFLIFASINPGRTHADVEAAIQTELDILLLEGVTEEELVRAKTKVRAYTAYAQDGAYSVASGLNEAIAVGDWTLFTRQDEQVQEVTREQVNEAARIILNTDARTVGNFIPVRNEAV
jgi:zinc protease